MTTPTPQPIAAPELAPVEAMREEFEAWLTDDGASPEAARRTPSGDYSLMIAAHSWGVWRAATAKASQRHALESFGQLDPRTATEQARTMLRYCDAFNGQSWGGIDESADRKNFAVALDNLLETAAMLLNMAGRVKPHAAPADHFPDAGNMVAPTDSEVQR